MKANEIVEFMKIHRELEDSLSMNVKIGHYEVLRITISDLISKRNSPSNLKRDAFDEVLKCYLTLEEFDKYVIEGKPLTE